jgi:hypothetical protein
VNIKKEKQMSTETLLLVIGIILLAGILPVWGHSRSWGYGPTGVLALLLVVFLIWAVAEERPLFRRSAGDDIESAAQDAGRDIKEAGRDVADSIRRTVD